MLNPKEGEVSSLNGKLVTYAHEYSAKKKRYRNIVSTRGFPTPFQRGVGMLC